MKKKITLSHAEMSLVVAALEFTRDHVYDSQGDIDAFIWRGGREANVAMAQEASKIMSAVRSMDYDEFVIEGQDYDDTFVSMHMDVVDIQSERDAQMVVSSMVAWLIADAKQYELTRPEADYHGGTMDEWIMTAKEILVDSNYDRMSKMQILWVMRA